ncbi:MAG: GNAT family N-acetyltransferase [Clostridiales bacterium]|nr:GNAT family N-acetyltransferase [Clostridiales bacterium]
MPDMLVKLYDLKDNSELYTELEKQGIRLFRPMTPNQDKLRAFITPLFGDGWSNEISTAFTRFPVSCFIAYDTEEKKIVGFAGYDCTMRGFFGPTGVDPAYRGKGIGKALLLKCLEAMRNEGYGYAVIGGAGPVNFYEKCCGATVIEGSIPGVYEDLI